MKTSKFLIGIDPDVNKSGFAVIKGDKIELSNLTFFQIFDYLKFYQYREDKPIIYIECGFLNKSNWHINANTTTKSGTQIGQRTGANHEVSKKLCEMCEYLGLEFHQVRPTARKFNADYFKQLTGITTRTNQETRDALMLIYGR